MELDQGILVVMEIRKSLLLTTIGSILYGRIGIVLLQIR